MKTVIVCPCCGSARVYQDASVNVNTGEQGLHDSMICADCGYDGHTFNEVEAPDDFDVDNDKYEEKS